MASERRVDLEAARQLDLGRHVWKYTERDVILYALGLGCDWHESRYVYENNGDFAPLPTFPVLALYQGALQSLDIDRLLPNYNPVLWTSVHHFSEACMTLPMQRTLGN